MTRPAALLAALAVLLLASADPSGAATLSGTFKKAVGKRVVVVLPGGTGKTAKVPANGKVSIAGLTLDGASVHLVNADGSYFGPVVLGRSKNGKKAYAAIKGSAKLALGTVTLKKGYASTGGVKQARQHREAKYTASAVAGKPIGAGKLGRVLVGGGTGALAGRAGSGRDADLDGIPAVFDVDDDGDLVLDNVDRSARSAARAAVRAAPRDGCGPPPLPACSGPGPSESSGFKLFSNFKLTGPESINAYLGSSTEVNALIASQFPVTLSLATQVIADGATLDCLGSAYCAAHSAGGQDYPRLNGAAATTDGTTIRLEAGGTGDAQIVPGASAAEVKGGDAFVQIAGDKSYPGLLNFAFTTAPAVRSVETALTGGEHVLDYGADGREATGLGMSRGAPIPVGADGRIHLTWWRPQRLALPGETSASDWIDIGGLRYTADAPNAIGGGGGGPGNCASGSYSETSSNGAAFANPADTEGVRDPAADAATDPAQAASRVLGFTIDASVCFGASWATAPAGTAFDFDIQAVSEFGDNAARKLYFVKDA